MTDKNDLRGYWNERYRARGNMWGVEANRFVAGELDGWAPRRVLDLACGQGRNAIWLALQGHAVTAVDVSNVAIEQARLIAAEAGVDVDFEVHDLMEWSPPGNAFDLVVLSYLQLPESMRRKVHRDAVAALAPGGHVLLIAHHRDNLEHGFGGPPSADVLFDETQLADDFASLTIMRNERVLRPAEKDGESGTAIDILVIAEKSAV